VQKAKSQHRQLWSSISLQASPELQPGGMSQPTPGAPHLGSGPAHSCVSGAQPADAAKAGVRIDEMTGVAQTTAVPTPIRLSMRRREIGSL
jgi:hypothetical protein